MAKLEEIEIGPHFLTFYISPKPQKVMERVYREFVRRYPDMADIQQHRFIHVTNDPNVYHPYGSPDRKPGRTTVGHFHIRTMASPCRTDISACLEIIEKYADISQYKITHLEDFKENDFEYPEIPLDKQEYLLMIDRLKGNDV